MRNLKNRDSRYRKIAYAGVALLAVGAVIAVAGYGTFWKGDTEERADTPVLWR